MRVGQAKQHFLFFHPTKCVSLFGAALAGKNLPGRIVRISFQPSPSPLPSNAHEICSPSSWGLSGVGGGSFHLPPPSLLFPRGAPVCTLPILPPMCAAVAAVAPTALLSLRRHATAGNTCETRPRYLSLSLSTGPSGGHTIRARAHLSCGMRDRPTAGCQTFPSEFLNPMRCPLEPILAQPMPVYPWDQWSRVDPRLIEIRMVF